MTRTVWLRKKSTWATTRWLIGPGGLVDRRVLTGGGRGLPSRHGTVESTLKIGLSIKLIDGLVLAIMKVDST
jgi:hypothetical protein